MRKNSDVFDSDGIKIIEHQYSEILIKSPPHRENLSCPGFIGNAYTVVIKPLMTFLIESQEELSNRVSQREVE